MSLSNEKLAERLRQILELLTDAPREWTTVPDDQGDIIGNDEFVGVGLIEDAKALLQQWDEEDALVPSSTPETHPREGDRP